MHFWSTKNEYVAQNNTFMTVWGVCLNEVQDGLSIPTCGSSVAFWDASTGIWHPLTWKSDTRETQITVAVTPVEFQFGWEVSFITMATNHKLRCCTCLLSVWCPSRGFLRCTLVWGKVLVVCLAPEWRPMECLSHFYGPINSIIQLLKGVCGCTLATTQRWSHAQTVPRPHPWGEDQVMFNQSIGWITFWREISLCQSHCRKHNL